MYWRVCSAPSLPDERVPIATWASRSFHARAASKVGPDIGPAVGSDAKAASRSRAGSEATADGSGHEDNAPTITRTVRIEGRTEASAERTGQDMEGEPSSAAEKSVPAESILADDPP